MSASRLNSDTDFILWRKRLESVRKDIECFFGRLKGRFRILKLPIVYQDKAQIDDIFITCVGLQNMLHDWDGQYMFSNNGLSWVQQYGNFNDALGEHWGVPTVRGFPVTEQADCSRFGVINFRDDQHVHFDDHAVGSVTIEQLVTLQVESSQAFKELQEKLVVSYHAQQRAGNVIWLRS